MNNDLESRKTNRQFTKELIQLYKSFPCLWNLKSYEYYDRNLRTNAYKVLEKKMQEVHPGADRMTVVRKINCLRSNHRKEQRKFFDRAKTGRTYKTNLWYYHLFDFLSGVTRPNSTNLQVMESIQIQNIGVLEGTPKSKPPEPTLVIKEEYNQVDNYPEDGPEPSYQHTYDSFNIPQPTPTEPVSNYKTTSFTDKEDRHDVFGKNVAMKLRHLSSTNDTQRIMAEKIINETLSLAEMGLLSKHIVRC